MIGWEKDGLLFGHGVDIWLSSNDYGILPDFAANGLLKFIKSPSALSDSTAEGEKLMLFFDNFTIIAVDKFGFGTYNSHDMTKGMPQVFLRENEKERK